MAAAFSFEGAARQVVLGLKYRNRRAVARHLAHSMVRRLHLPAVDLVTWAPTSPGHARRRGFDQAVLDWVGLPVDAFDARVQAAYSEPLPTLVVADRNDKQTPYDDAADLARAVGAEFMTTEGLGHRRILRDPDVIDRVVAFVGGREREQAGSLATA